MIVTTAYHPGEELHTWSIWSEMTADGPRGFLTCSVTAHHPKSGMFAGAENAKADGHAYLLANRIPLEILEDSL